MTLQLLQRVLLRLWRMSSRRSSRFLQCVQVLYQYCLYQALLSFISSLFLDWFLTSQDVSTFKYAPQVLVFIVLFCLIFASVYFNIFLETLELISLLKLSRICALQKEKRWNAWNPYVQSSNILPYQLSLSCMHLWLSFNVHFMPISTMPLYIPIFSHQFLLPIAPIS